MTCINCQSKIEKKLNGTAGVQSATVSYNARTAAITYDSGIISLGELVSVIEKLDYEVLLGNERQVSKVSRVAGLLIIIASLYMVLEYFGILNLLAPSQLAETNMGYGMLFVIGLITSVHCIAMCGGINLSQCIPKSGRTVSNSRFSTFRPTFLYNLGRVISYTAVGFIVGALGSAITFSNSAQGVLKLIAGIFMVIMGINMLGIFPWLRRLNPRMPKFFVRKINPEKSGSNSPLIVGLLNGLIPCGPLQAMQIYALSTGNPIMGAISMFLFSLDTVPLMFGLGAISSALGKKFTQKIMTVGAVLVVVLGLSMLTQGWSLSGFSLPSNTAASPNGAASGADGIAVENGVQVVNSTLLSNKYPNITVQAGLDTPWVINHSSSNFSLLVPVYSTELDLQSGANPVFLSPEESFDFSNGNSKFFGYVKVVDDLSAIDPDSIKEETTGFKTMIYPSDTFQSNGGGGGGCCG